MGLEVSRNVVFKACLREDGQQGVCSLCLRVKLLLGLRMVNTGAAENCGTSGID